MGCERRAGAGHGWQNVRKLPGRALILVLKIACGVESALAEVEFPVLKIALGPWRVSILVLKIALCVVKTYAEFRFLFIKSPWPP